MNLENGIESVPVKCALWECKTPLLFQNLHLKGLFPRFSEFDSNIYWIYSLKDVIWRLYRSDYLWDRLWTINCISSIHSLLTVNSGESVIWSIYFRICAKNYLKKNSIRKVVYQNQAIHKIYIYFFQTFQIISL